ncbi:PilZ domain-containing protein [Desulfuromonas soudanensis]|uniref:PilZ domain-containing protein n=1 Tax=Desulfuromonas soudanensis TaxID=1603606 RepID=A0A0M4D3X7_9BACT|nr:PilZ domain-containing protein [Desulfuromonas soudanensis]ALC17984.1 PilZ domain-containing protein [Desulfuromonas soudanensis]
MAGDKRNIRRHRKRLQVKFGVEEAGRFGFTEDLSDTGIFIKSAVVQNPNSVLKLELTSPGGEIIYLVGRVMWARKVPPNLLQRLKGGMGVRILNITSGENTYRSLLSELKERL